MIRLSHLRLNLELPLKALNQVFICLETITDYKLVFDSYYAKFDEKSKNNYLGKKHTIRGIKRLFFNTTYFIIDSYGKIGYSNQ